jgi:hypothetical protein
MEAKEMRLVDSALYDKLMNLAKKLSQNNTTDPEHLGPRPQLESGIKPPIQLSQSTIPQKDETTENILKTEASTDNINSQKETSENSFKIGASTDEDHIVSAFPTKVQSRVRRVLNFIRNCDRIQFNEKYQLIMDRKLYKDSNIIDNISDMMYPIKSLPSIDLQIFYAMLQECNLPQTYITNPYRKRLRMEGYLFNQGQNKLKSRDVQDLQTSTASESSKQRKFLKTPVTKIKKKEKILKTLKIKNHRQKNKQSKLPMNWLTY